MIAHASCLMLALLAGQAEPAPSGDAKPQLSQLEPVYQRQAAEYQFAVQTGPDAAEPAEKEALTFAPQPLLRWTAEGNSGAVWIWTRQGRPALLGCLGAFLNGDNQLEGFHEFLMLDERPVQEVPIGPFLWRPETGAPIPSAISNAPAPNQNERLRLVQMRALAREFGAEMRAGTQTHVLRLAPTPLYRFEPTQTSDGSSGALFSFLWDNGTDPEAVLLIETRQVDGEWRWHYVPGRFTWREVWMTHRGERVWEVPERAESRSATILLDNYTTCPTGLLDTRALRQPTATTVEAIDPAPISPAPIPDAVPQSR